jgi:hypothetical protein
MALPYGVSSIAANVSGVGATPPIVPVPPSSGAVGGSPSGLYGTLLVFVTGTVNFTVEITGDDTDASGYVSANGNWMALTNYSSLTTSQSIPIGSALTALRVVVNSGTGSILVQFIQWTR